VQRRGRLRLSERVDDLDLSAPGVDAEHTPALAGRVEHMLEHATLGCDRCPSLARAVQTDLADVRRIRRKLGEAVELVLIEPISHKGMRTARQANAAAGAEHGRPGIEVGGDSVMPTHTTPARPARASTASVDA
jgi:hypothetical protein